MTGFVRRSRSSDIMAPQRGSSTRADGGGGGGGGTRSRSKTAGGSIRSSVRQSSRSSVLSAMIQGKSINSLLVN